jgi:hypothetical protein
MAHVCLLDFNSGVDGEEAKKKIEEDMPGLNVVVVPKVRASRH